MPWWYAVAERDHDIQNPTSREKIVQLGHVLCLTPDMHVLDVACGKAGPALILAREFGCRITGVERASEFAAAARERVAAAGLGEQIDIIERDAKEFALEPGRYEVAMCLGASFVWGDIEGTLSALAPAVRPRGHVVVGEPYWRAWPLPDGSDDEGYVALADTVSRFADADLEITALIASSEDDWDRYESLHWRALDDWLAANADDPDADDFRERHETRRREYLEWQRALLGWAIFVSRKT
jgi:SAM-dependent methyltransferase